MTREYQTGSPNHHSSIPPNLSFLQIWRPGSCSDGLGTSSPETAVVTWNQSQSSRDHSLRLEGGMGHALPPHSHLLHRATRSIDLCNQGSISSNNKACLNNAPHPQMYNFKGMLPHPAANLCVAVPTPYAIPPPPLPPQPISHCPPPPWKPFSQHISASAVCGLNRTIECVVN